MVGDDLLPGDMVELHGRPHLWIFRKPRPECIPSNAIGEFIQLM
jgi:hypothetical protein